MKRILLLSMAIVMLMGCATTPPPEEQPPLLRLVVEAAVLRYLAGNPEQIDDAQRLLAHVQEYADLADELSVGALVEMGSQWVPWEKIKNPADRVVLWHLLTAVGDLIEQEVGSGTLETESIVRVRVYLDWLIEVVDRARL